MLRGQRGPLQENVASERCAQGLLFMSSWEAMGWNLSKILGRDIFSKRIQADRNCFWIPLKFLHSGFEIFEGIVHSPRKRGDVGLIFSAMLSGRDG